MRKAFIGGNWKSNNTLKETQTLISNVVDKLEFDKEKTCMIKFIFRGYYCSDLSSSCYCSFHEKTT